MKMDLALSSERLSNCFVEIVAVLGKALSVARNRDLLQLLLRNPQLGEV